MSTDWASSRELGWNPGHTIVTGTFDTQITQGHQAGTEGKQTCYCNTEGGGDMFPHSFIEASLGRDLPIGLSSSGKKIFGTKNFKTEST
jgi:hypothetical protein